jgi:hypothetical protein
MRTPPHLALLQARARLRRGQAPPPSNPSQPTGAAGMTNHLLAPTLDEHLSAVPGTAHGSTLGRPHPGFQFVQRSGSRAGQDYNVVTGKSGLSIRKYEGGDTAIARTDQDVNIAAQRRDMAARPPQRDVGAVLRDLGLVAPPSAQQLVGAGQAQPLALRQPEPGLQGSAAIAEMVRRLLQARRGI